MARIRYPRVAFHFPFLAQMLTEYVPSLSVLEGWCIEGATGWSIGARSDGAAPAGDRFAEDAAALYERLENAVLPTFYQHREKFIDMMRHAIAVNGSFFNTQRMMQQYVLKAYFE